MYNLHREYAQQVQRKKCAPTQHSDRNSLVTQNPFLGIQNVGKPVLLNRTRGYLEAERRRGDNRYHFAPKKMGTNKLWRKRYQVIENL